ncbi:VOC family protein [Pedobacter heparinus]|uniref:Glyoxalase/bleomycin resistance protein/dioxygenase n=1 Tax=Pedobacter heparinus (strain ATCC 13125 / DSM 2366 / CIP 104194 / JCM 7457 / NBRC 12017 / NCIMB 9290 / NRRL B-14731 / HIM 762-3) TaxID=485917 RepID=C6XVD0_PEDHD|nr:VOC family protein [Pedobacter heparinus]ACU03996.1 Glyoxalase/bleomycin resistance protein/dioxygenase [Pedobacter heparinus DSM 2366]
MKAIENIILPVSNQNISKEFYLKLGFQIVIEVDMGEGHQWIQLGLNDQYTTIALLKNWPYSKLVAGSFQGLILETDDIYREKEELERKGIYMSEIRETRSGKIAFIKDPDDNGLTIHQFIFRSQLNNLKK